MIDCLQVYNIYLQYKNYTQEQANYITTTLKSSIDEELSLRSRRDYSPDTLGQQHCYFKNAGKSYSPKTVRKSLRSRSGSLVLPRSFARYARSLRLRRAQPPLTHRR